ncbi:peptide/nickel transport system permease protein [Hymenobacter daecheongensis DSM 21074]|uniref:Peptide/nickel transport system permease protein n=1 Tax=Hymenobacter daecheongensis DSM 21074 TaxID=1121955 RepID=A0A1M6CWI6_9BACT|nr:ABC transporter permease [Hymenobacter daecheongensis]SHI65382.1 peptide/nickel transport system permease protein [Hymenobacter daecheongensis DSM 21074]
MGRFLLHRLLRALLAAWAIISVIFLLSRAGAQERPPASRLAEGSLSATTASPVQRRQAGQLQQRRLGLTGPLFYVSAAPAPAAGLGWRWHWNGRANQYHQWLRRLVHANLGVSFRDGQPVTLLLGQSLRYTLPLTVGAAVCSIGLVWLVAPHLGRPSWRRRFLLGLFFVVDAVPLFVVALLLLLLLANPDALAWFPAYGLGPEDAAAPWPVRLQALAYHLALPLLTLTLASLPALAVPLDAALRHELRADYVLTARAKGLPDSLVIRHHALRNALLPALTLLTELLPGLVAGSVVVELVYSLPGMGRLLAEAAAAHDYPVLLGGVLLIALVRLLGQLLADWLYTLADPRIRLPV